MLSFLVEYFFFFKQKTAYEMRISDWSSDVCSSDLRQHRHPRPGIGQIAEDVALGAIVDRDDMGPLPQPLPQAGGGSLIPLPQSPQPLRPPQHLPARNLLGEVPPLQPRPFPRLAPQRLHLQLALRILPAHPLGPPAPPHLPRPHPLTHPRHPAPPVGGG